MMRVRLLVVAWAALAIGGTAAAAEVSLDEAIQAAVQHSPMVRVRDAAIDVAKTERTQGRARLRPTLAVTGDLKVWNKAQDVSFGGGGGDAITLPPPSTPYEAAIAGLLQGFSTPTRIQEQVTGSIGVSLMQPLTDLISTRSTREALALGLDSAEAGRAEAARQAAVEAVGAWLRLHLAMAMATSAEQSVVEFEPRLKQLEALVQGGVALESDRLRLKVAQAAAMQDVIAARAQVKTAQTMLATAMGLDIGAARDLTPAPVDPSACRADTTELDVLVEQALTTRPELESARATGRQAELGVDLAKARMWPSVSAVAAYTHLEGQGLAVKDSAFVGLNLRWNVFEWGATHSGIAAARARSRQAEQQLAALSDMLRVQIEQARQDLYATAEAQGVAAMAEALAAEGLRLDSARYDAGDATATDVVTAESALHKARDQRVATGFRCLLARATLRAAVGDTLNASTLLSEGGER
jgi:outer membrane protein TolC